MGQVSGEYRLQRRKSWVEAPDGLHMIIIVVSSAMTGLHRLLSLRFQVSLHYSFYGALFRATVNFHVDGRGLVYSYVLITFFFLHFAPFCFPSLSQTCFHFLPSSRPLFVALAVGWCGGVLVGAVACIVLLVLDGPAIALRDRPLSPRYHGPVVDFDDLSLCCIWVLFLMYMCAKNVL
jgi:hypothetical protein